MKLLHNRFKNAGIALASVFILFTSQLLFSQSAAVKWNLISDQSVSSITSCLIGYEQKLSNMEVIKYEPIPGSFNYSQSTSIKGELWPLETQQNKNRFIQFAVRCKPGIVFNINTVSMYYTGKGGGNMKINIAYSTDSNFVSPTQLNLLGTPVAISSNAGALQLLTYSLNSEINSSKTFYLRIYPWYTLELYNKFVCLQDVIISGSTAGSVIPSLPIVSTAAITEITTVSALCGGNLISDGDAIITASGVCWSNNRYPTINDFKNVNEFLLSTYVSPLTGLERNTKYFVRAYATNIAGMSYGNLDSLITLSELSTPTVITNAEIKVIGTSAVCKGTVKDWGGSNVLERGFCFSTALNPTINNNKLIIGTGTGTYSVTLFQLSRNTKYYLRAYAINNQGVAYGEVKEFFIRSPLKGTFADGVHKDTKAIQAVIDSCSATGGGGIVLFKDGHYLTAPLELKKDVTLHIDSTAIIFGSKEMKDYYLAGADTTQPPKSLRPLITSNKANNLSIIGKGIIDGNGQVWWPDAIINKTAGTSDVRPLLIKLNGGQNILLQDITLRNSPMYNFVPYSCRNVVVKNVTIKAPSDSPNTDGIDPYISHNVRISDCTIDVGDDNIALKSGSLDPANSNAACSNVIVTNCTFLHGHGMSIGSETYGGVDSLLVENCTFKWTDNGLRIKSDRDRGGNVRGAVYRNITMDSVSYPIQFTEYYPTIPSQTDPAQPIVSKTPFFHDITVENMTATNSRYGGIIIGRPESFIKNINFRNVAISARSGLTIRNASVNFINSRISVLSGNPIIYELNGTLTGIKEKTGQVPVGFSLSQNYPNPFNPSTTINYSIASAGNVTLKVYDILGREVAILVNEFKQPGNYTVMFSVETLHGASLPSGIYFYRLQAGSFSETKKFVLMK